jgi:hypothetical protein
LPPPYYSGPLPLAPAAVILAFLRIVCFMNPLTEVQDMVTQATVSVPLPSTDKPVRVQRKKTRRFWLHDRTLGYLFLTPALLVILCLVAYPFANAIVLTFQQKTAGAPGRFIGLANYRELLGSDIFLRTVFNTVFYHRPWCQSEIPPWAQHGAGAQSRALVQ